MRFTTPGSAGLALHRSPPIRAYQVTAQSLPSAGALIKDDDMPSLFD